MNPYYILAILTIALCLPLVAVLILNHLYPADEPIDGSGVLDFDDNLGG